MAIPTWYAVRNSNAKTKLGILHLIAVSPQTLCTVSISVEANDLGSAAAMLAPITPSGS
jgi:hypothetical protein